MKRLVLLLCGFLLSATGAFCGVTGSVVGTVTDTTGGVIGRDSYSRGAGEWYHRRPRSSTAVIWNGARWCTPAQFLRTSEP